MMKIEGVPFSAIQWSAVPSVEYAGQHGKAYWQTLEVGNIRVRLVEYSPGYLADHWCQRGHVVLVLEGELTTELKDGRTVLLTPGMSYHVADGADAHRSSTSKGARLFIVD
jgi:quercetin dioxygenase-like cupin family protein